MTTLINHTVLDKFKVQRFIDRGETTSTYLALDTQKSSNVALKIAHPSPQNRTSMAKSCDRFETVFQFLTSTQHPNLPRARSWGKMENGQAILVTEFVKGQPLNEFLQHCAPLRWSHVQDLFLQLVSATAALHRAGLVHQNIAPENIILSLDKRGELQVKLFGFGSLEREESPQRELSPLGNLRYTAPEQFCGFASFTSDIFSLGAILWWAISGEELMKDVDSESSLYLWYEEFGAPPAVEEYVLGASDQLSQTLSNMLHPNPEKRPSADVVLRHFIRRHATKKIKVPLKISDWNTGDEKHDSDVYLADFDEPFYEEI